MPFPSDRQRRAAYAKRGQPGEPRPKVPLAKARRKAFSHEEANDIRLTVQEDLMERHREKPGEPSLEDVQEALMDCGMPESWATSQAPDLHAAICNDLREERKENEEES